LESIGQVGECRKGKREKKIRGERKEKGEEKRCHAQCYSLVMQQPVFHMMKCGRKDKGKKEAFWRKRGKGGEGGGGKGPLKLPPCCSASQRSLGFSTTLAHGAASSGRRKGEFPGKIKKKKRRKKGERAKFFGNPYAPFVPCALSIFMKVSRHKEEKEGIGKKRRKGKKKKGKP